MSLLLTAFLLLADDAWRVPALEASLDSALESLAGFPDPLYPPDREVEVLEALEELARLDPDSAASRARALLQVVSKESELAWAARRALVRSGDLTAIRLALDSYFEAPQRWRRVLGASEDPRLRDFRDGVGPVPLSERYLLTSLERNLARARDRQSIRALLAWASSSPDPSSPRRVLTALPRGIPLEASVRAWLARNGEAPDEGAMELPEGALALKDWILALSPDARFAALRTLAESDHEALSAIPMSREQVDRLYPYFARSGRSTVRDRVRRAFRARGEALASLLLSPAADDAEKRETLAAMRDAWAFAIASHAGIFEILTKFLPRAELERFVVETPADDALLDALAVVPWSEARLRLESIGTREAIDRLLRRPDRFLSLSALSRLGRAGERSAALALVSLGAPGSSAWLRLELAEPGDRTALLEAVMRAPTDAPVALELARQVASSPSPSPSGFAALARLPLVEPPLSSPSALTERVHLAMSIRGERPYLPVLIDLATRSLASVSKASRDAAFAALAEADLDSFAPRLHRLAGDPDREVRFGAASALVPSGEAWTLRVLLANIDPKSSAERAIARGVVRRLAPERARKLLGEMIEDGTAGTFGVLLYLETTEEPAIRQERLFRLIAEDARAGDPSALLAASRLALAEAIAVVSARLSDR
ncbi:MAG TPA: hypothetical protein VJ921_01120 [Vicinamibacteria bacterium]|nr:hypothetical protein [Vicinamibacteria bacterium]